MRSFFPIILILVVLVAITGCNKLDTPQSRYFTVVGAVTATGKLVETYVDTCNTLGTAAPCRNKYPAINAGAKTLEAAMHQADKVFVTKDSQYYDLSLTAVENATNDLQNILKE